jgi:hypothetical protein
MSNQSPRDFREWVRLQERRDAQNRSIPALIAGAVDVVRGEIGTGGGASTLHPTAPIELVYQTALYLDTSGRQRVRFLMDFPDVTKATTGEDLVIAKYELWGRDITQSILTGTTSAVAAAAAPGLTLPGLAATPATIASEAADVKPWLLVQSAPGSGFRVDDFVPGSLWEFHARAIGATTVIPGEWSITVQVQMLEDTTPPPQPTAPVATASRGVITVEWDGQSVLGSMPGDFKYAILAHGTASSPTMEIARFGRSGGFTVVADIPYYDPQFFRLKAVDESGNESPWSEQAVAYTTPLVDADIILSTIDAAQTHLKNINAGVSILPNTVITEHLVVTEEMTAALANFLYIKADKIDVNSLATDEVFTGLLDAILVRADMFVGKTFEGGTFTTTLGGKFQTDVEELVGVKLTSKGLDAWSDSGVHTLEFDTATGDLSIWGGTFTGARYQTHSAENVGIKLDPLSGLQSYSTTGQLQFDVKPTGATFTGKVSSGFNPNLQAVLSDNVYTNRPGVQFNIGLFDSVQPFVTGWATHNDFPWGEGMLHMSSGRTAFDPPAEIYLSRNGTWQIGKPLARIYSAGNFVEVVRDDSYLRMHGDYTSLWYGATTAAAGGNGFVQAYGLTRVYASAIELEGTVTVMGNLGTTGSKNFIMDHPTKPGQLLVHGATESPVSGVEYWGTGTVGANGSDVFHLPEYFSALVKADTECVSVYGNGAVVGWGAVVDNSVTVTGPAGTQYSWLVKAERIGGDFEVERVKPPVRPSGPPPRPTPPPRPEPPRSRTLTEN